MNTNKFSAKDLAYIAIGAALIAICSWITIPGPVPFTLQTFAVFCVLGLLGGKRGTIAVIIYILLGAIGIPVFSGFGAGLGVLLGSTGGYIIGFIFIGLLYWMFEKQMKGKLWLRILVLVLGLIVCYAFGTAWFMVVYTRKSGAIGLSTALGWCVFPFILPDLIKMALAVLISERLRRQIQ
ncbi:MAG: biotin transporter BioY [Lachnospiraceae bacterium]|nr:biotin transporter BioY [Lachnospiraceae bacterium]